MNNQLIIARYNEDLFWLNEWQSQFDIVVYNKGKDDLKQDYKIINLPNIGREAHTYLYHIVNNYDTLAENNIFLHIIFEILKKFYIQNTNPEYRIQNFIYKKRTE